MTIEWMVQTSQLAAVGGAGQGWGGVGWGGVGWGGVGWGGVEWGRQQSAAKTFAW